MFIQVIQGPVSDAAELRASMDRWREELAPGATGWLGSTSGVTEDGTFIGLVRFESEQAARRNSDRREQHQWWMETSKLFTGEVAFHDCRDTITFLAGGSDDAGFVQVIQGRVLDLERMRTLRDEFGLRLAELRPEIIGSTVALHGEGGFTQAVYFTTEAAAREGERKEVPPDLQATFEQQQALVADQTFFDFRTPWLESPR